MYGKQIAKSELRTFSWEGFQAVIVKQKIVEGPTTMLDRHVNLPLSFDDIDKLYAIAQNARAKLAADRKRLDEINARNQEGGA